MWGLFFKEYDGQDSNGGSADSLDEVHIEERSLVLRLLSIGNDLNIHEDDGDVETEDIEGEEGREHDGSGEGAMVGAEPKRRETSDDAPHEDEGDGEDVLPDRSKHESHIDQTPNPGTNRGDDDDNENIETHREGAEDVDGRKNENETHGGVGGGDEVGLRN